MSWPFFLVYIVIWYPYQSHAGPASASCPSHSVFTNFVIWYLLIRHPTAPFRSIIDHAARALSSLVFTSLSRLPPLNDIPFSHFLPPDTPVAPPYPSLPLEIPMPALPKDDVNIAPLSVKLSPTLLPSLDLAVPAPLAESTV